MVMKVKSGSRSVMSDSLCPHGLYSPWNSPGQNTGVGSCSLLQRIFPIPDQTQISCIAGGFFLPAEPPGKPKNKRVGSLSLLQQIFPTQESNWGLLHRRQILYQLNYQGNPILKLNSNILVKVKVKSLSRVQLFETPWTVAYQAPPSVGFSRQEYWSGLPFPSPEGGVYK